VKALRVTGALPSGQVYQVEITGDRAQPVVGSRLVAVMVDQAEGDLVRPSPTEAPIPVDPEDPRSVLALLEERTTVTDWQGTPPRPPGVHVAGTVY
jgi:hypothetical protein